MTDSWLVDWVLVIASQVVSSAIASGVFLSFVTVLGKFEELSVAN